MNLKKAWNRLFGEKKEPSCEDCDGCVARLVSDEIKEEIEEKVNLHDYLERIPDSDAYIVVEIRAYPGMCRRRESTTGFGYAINEQTRKRLAGK